MASKDTQINVVREKKLARYGKHALSFRDGWKVLLAILSRDEFQMKDEA